MSTVDTTVESVTLTAEDIQAMKMADSASFHVRDGKAVIRIWLDSYRGATDRIYTAKEQRLFPANRNYASADRIREIPCANWTLVSYDKEEPTSRYQYDETLRPKVTAYASCSSARFHHRYLTVVELLRAGDSIELRFTADNGTENTRGAGFVRDTFDLLVRRPSRKTVMPMTFRLDDYCGPRNSARMVQV